MFARSKTIAFVLPGRNTLSEHLPDEIIDICVMIVQRSANLRKILVQQALMQPSARQIALPDVDPVGFRRYVEWLETGRIEFQPIVSDSASGMLLRDAFDLVFAHIVGSQFEEPDFQDYIIDTIARLLDTSQTPDLKVLEVVFLEKNAPMILKQFIVDRMFAAERKMLSMMRGGRRDQERKTQSAIGCEYHVHEVGECYKEKHQNTNAVNVTTVTPKDVNWTGASGPHNSQSTRSSSSSSKFYNKPTMADAQYFGSMEWSRQVHGLGRTTPTPKLQIDKPLPNIPRVTPGALPSLSSSTSSLRSCIVEFPPVNYLDSLCSRPEIETLGTQKLISECLGGLPQSNGFSTRPRDVPSDLHRAAIPGLVLECLERLNKQSLGDSSSPESLSSETSSPVDNLPPPWLMSRNSNVLPSPVAHLRVDWQPSFGEFAEPQLRFPKENHRGSRPFASSPANGFTRKSSPPEMLEAVPTSPPPSRTQSSILASPSPLCHNPSSVERKAVPPRGTDWLKQYDRINSMMNEAPLVPAKQSKKSKFREMLRSDSRAAGA